MQKRDLFFVYVCKARTRENLGAAVFGEMREKYATDVRGF